MKKKRGIFDDTDTDTDTDDDTDEQDSTITAYDQWLSDNPEPVRPSLAPPSIDQYSGTGAYNRYQSDYRKWEEAKNAWDNWNYRRRIEESRSGQG